MRAFVLAAISAYQRFLSPYKGFCCAYRAHTGRQSCSTLGFRAIRRFGILAGLAVLRRRTFLCGVAHRRYGGLRRHPFNSQSGFCDMGCDLPSDLSCDLPSTGSSSSGSGLTDCCCDAANCDWPSKKKNGQQPEQKVYLPPGVGIQHQCNFDSTHRR